LDNCLSLTSTTSAGKRAPAFSVSKVNLVIINNNFCQTLLQYKLYTQNYKYYVA
jgi:hypothetical protein